MNRLAILRKMPCCQCGKFGAEVAHSNFSIHGKGRGIKADDEYTIPLCRICHQKFDGYVDLNRDEAMAWFLFKLAKVNNALAQMGVEHETAF